MGVRWMPPTSSRGSAHQKGRRLLHERLGEPAGPALAADVDGDLGGGGRLVVATQSAGFGQAGHDLIVTGGQAGVLVGDEVGYGAARVAGIGEVQDQRLAGFFDADLDADSLGGLAGQLDAVAEADSGQAGVKAVVFIDAEGADKGSAARNTAAGADGEAGAGRGAAGGAAEYAVVAQLIAGGAIGAGAVTDLALAVAVAITTAAARTALGQCAGGIDEATTI